MWKEVGDETDRQAQTDAALVLKTPIKGGT